MRCTESSILAVVVATFATQPTAAQDTVRVRADNPPLWGANVRLVEELAIGRADGPSEYAFGRIYHAAPDRDGSFYLYDVNDRQIRRYDARGRFEGLIGRRGGGPGEYQHVGGMMVDASGSLVVFDPGSRRITHYGPDGKMRRELSTTRGSFDAFVIDSAGRFYFIVTAGGRMMGHPLTSGELINGRPGLGLYRRTAGTKRCVHDFLRVDHVDEAIAIQIVAGRLGA